jgi:very-short-patch-repair endonuclease
MNRAKNPETGMAAKQLCRKLRTSQTEAEQIFWRVVRNRQFQGVKFYRQYPLFFEYYGQERFFIADFFCFEKKLVVELDGKIHDAQQDYDALRTHIITTLEINVIRFRNEEIQQQLGHVLEKLRAKFM